ncbi:hypothetical protein QCA50_001813 [Cerrena zonata]|uniref:Uncharacterized protein n=1 Tax=Cerrena zonata TaxID=2478898 RepID=A0AAW0GMF2_9APHY
MRLSTLYAVLALPLVALAQSNSQSASQSATQAQTTQQASQNVSIILSTSFTTGETLGAGRVVSTFTSGVVFTITSAPAQATGNGTNTGNTTTSNNSSSAKPSSTAPLPTAATDIPAGGGANGAPSPGASSSNGAMGPDDSFTSSVLATHVNALLLTVAGVAVGGTLVLM